MLTNAHEFFVLFLEIRFEHWTKFVGFFMIDAIFGFDSSLRCMCDFGSFEPLVPIYRSECVCMCVCMGAAGARIRMNQNLPERFQQSMPNQRENMCVCVYGVCVCVCLCEINRRFFPLARSSIRTIGFCVVETGIKRQFLTYSAFFTRVRVWRDENSVWKIGRENQKN